MNQYEKIPNFLIDMLEQQYGSEITGKILQGYSSERKVTFRVNTIKSNVNEIKTKLDELGIEYEGVVWSQEAFILKNTRQEQIKKLEMYEKGEIYLQSLSSMLPPIILNPQPYTDILDMAAAPGGKTTQIAALTGNKAYITACEMNVIRSERLKYNIEKQGAASVYIMISDSRKMDDFFSFDYILLDAPCSGSGILNMKDSKIEKKFTIKLIEKSAKSQLDLLKKAIKILKPGQEMVYSTCSILDYENEQIVNEILREGMAQIVPIVFNGIENIPQLPVKIQGTLCVCPNELFEGFFVAKIRKNNEGR